MSTWALFASRRQLSGIAAAGDRRCRGSGSGPSADGKPLSLRLRRDPQGKQEQVLYGPRSQRNIDPGISLRPWPYVTVPVEVTAVFQDRCNRPLCHLSGRDGDAMISH